MHASTTTPTTPTARAKPNGLVELDAELVREAVDNATRRKKAKAARAKRAMRDLAEARARLTMMTQSRDAWRRCCVAGVGLLAITWTTAGLMTLLWGW